MRCSGAFPFLSASALVREDDFMGVGDVVLFSPYLRQIWLNCPFFPLPATNVTLCLFADTVSLKSNFLLAFYTCRDSKSSGT